VRPCVLVVVVLVATCASFVTGAAALGPSPVPDAPVPGRTASGFLGYCSERPEAKQAACYIRGLLAAVNRSGNPAYGLPRIDARVHATGGLLELACHSFMHAVGRAWARQHDVTLANLMSFIPRSNDPGCSAGFGMGMTMYLGPRILVDPPSALAICARLPTRYRSYTCVHGIGHALMRGFHGQLRDAVRACRTLGPMNAPDCSQGAFHDYWISLSGADGTTRPEGADTSARSLCAGYEFARPCWYRYFWERLPNERVYQAADIVRLCHGLEGLQRAGCVSGASLSLSRSREPVDHARTCGDLQGSDTIDCLRGVVVPAVANKPFERLRLIGTCAALPRTTRSRCYGWFGRTLNVVTDGRFRKIGCTRLADPRARVWCAAGAKHTNQPLRTFS
jgi:hypothetical protein